MAKRFHLGWFTNFTPGDWNGTFSNGTLSNGTGGWDGRFHVEMARALERACFDYIMLEDTLMVSEAHRGTSEATLKHALEVPEHDPLPLAAMIGTATRHLGVVATMSTMACPPFMPARLATMLDHIAGGRVGWTSWPAARIRRRRISACTSCRRARRAMPWPMTTSTWSASCSSPGSRARW